MEISTCHSSLSSKTAEMLLTGFTTRLVRCFIVCFLKCAVVILGVGNGHIRQVDYLITVLSSGPVRLFVSMEFLNPTSGYDCYLGSASGL